MGCGPAFRRECQPDSDTWIGGGFKRWNHRDSVISSLGGETLEGGEDVSWDVESEVLMDSTEDPPHSHLDS